MWVQVIEGQVKDEAGLRKQMDKWNTELRPNSKGFLGATAGVTSDGKFINVARFESEELAMQNSEDPKQAEWWNETAQYFEGEATFRNCNRVQEIRNGGSNDAGFVQVMQNTVTDIDKAWELGQKMAESTPSDFRPDFLGGLAAWDGELLTQTSYFSSEEEAREGEKQDMSEFAEKNPEAAKVFAELDSLSGEVTYFDLREPLIF